MNIRSLRLNFISLLATLHNIINSINFIILVETNIKNDEQHAFNINGFNSYFLNRDGRGGGVAVYIRENIVHTNIQINTVSFEVIQIDVTNKNKTLSLLTVYRPPKNNVNDFIIELDKTINTINKKQDLIIIGDININILTENITTTKYIEMISSNGLECIIKEITREDVTKRTYSCIDHLHTRNNKPNTQTCAAVVKTNISDHYALFCCIQDAKDQEIQNQGAENPVRHGTFLNSFKVNKNIKEVNWNALIKQNTNTNYFFDKIYNTFKNIYEISKSPSKNNKKQRKINPWINDELVKYCEVRDKLYIKWLNNKNNKIYELEYKKISKLFK